MARSGTVPARETLRQRQARRLMDTLEAMMERDMHPPKEDVEAMLDISPPEMRSLIWLARRGVSVMSDFAQGIGVPLSTATRIINRLVKKGIVVRRRSELDRRIVEIDLSETANAHKNEFLRKRQEAVMKMLSPLTAEECETLLGLMEKGMRLSGPPDVGGVKK